MAHLYIGTTPSANVNKIAKFLVPTNDKEWTLLQIDAALSISNIPIIELALVKFSCKFENIGGGVTLTTIPYGYIPGGEDRQRKWLMT